MYSLKTILMSGVAAASLAAIPALAQQATEPEGGAETEQMAQAPADRSYDETYGQDYAAWGDRTVDELLGTQVVNDAGETIGDIDDFGLAGDQLVAIVGIGGFLGIGEHEVAIPIDQLATQGDQMLLAGVTREQLEAMPEFNAEETQVFAQDQTLRGGYEGAATGGMTDTAGMTPSEDPANDQPMEDVDEEVAQATEEAGDAAGEAGQEVAQATEEAADAVGEAGEEVAQEAEEATEPTTDGADVAPEMAEADSTEPMAEEAETAEAQPADEEATEGAEMAETDATGQQAAEETEVTEAEQPMAGEEAETAQATEEPMATEEQAGADSEMAEAEGEAGWTEEMDSIFADIADREIAELIGMEVASADGEVVGEVDNFALEGQEVVAIVGVGGFLGIGEHEVALSLGEMTFDGEKLVLSSMTEEQLREMPEYEGDEASRLPEDQTLRGTYNQ